MKPFYRFAWTLLLVTWVTSRCSLCQPTLFGYRPLTDDKEIDFPYSDAVRMNEDGIFEFVVEAYTRLRLFGIDFSSDTSVSIVNSDNSCSPNEQHTQHTLGNMTLDDNDSENTSVIVLHVPDTAKHGTLYFFCFSADQAISEHQGTEFWKTLRVVKHYSNPIPLPVRIVFILILMVLSGMFSGLNLGLMALDINSLKIILESGTESQRKNAKIIYPVRKHGNYLLCTLLLGNVMVNSTFSILLGDLTNGLIAVIGSTFAIVIFGEIIPQAICSRYGLWVGAKTIWLTYLFMVVTFPVSFPMSKILDFILGEELGAIYNRDQLLHLLKVTGDKTDLEVDEVNIMTGALEFKKKTVAHVMTKISDVFCLEVNTFLDFKTIRQIYESGFSRIPVYEGNKNAMVGVLFLRDLAFIDPEDGVSLTSVLNFHKREVYSVYTDQHLDHTLEDFAAGKCHLAIVIEVISDKTDCDPFYKVVGVVTLEDIVEEILQTEICDETDRYVDNVTLKPRNLKQADLGGLVSNTTGPKLSPHQSLAIFQFLSTGVEPFDEEFVSPTILKKLLQQNVVKNMTYDEDTPRLLFANGRAANMFVLVIEGNVQVEVGKDKIQFSSRSFSHFGVRALMQVIEGGPLEYTPDFTVEIKSDCQLLVVTQMQYRAAYRATQFERDAKMTTSSSDRETTITDSFKQEWMRAQNGIVEITTSPKKAHTKKKRHRGSRSVSPDESTLLLSDEEIHESVSLLGPRNNAKTSMDSMNPIAGQTESFNTTKL